MILNVYKPKGWTSADVVAKLKGILRVKKIGHAGTLDPLAEGVLIVLTDKDTKRQDDFMKMEKEYQADMAFGAVSKTYDLEGKLEYLGEKMSEEELREKLEKDLPKFIGTYEQEVPHFSAVKVGGRALYKSARSSEKSDVVLPKKEVTVYSINVENIGFSEELQLPTARLQITCAKGFYVRSLANDLSGVLIGLVRTRIGDYVLADSKLISSFSTGA